MVLLVVSMVVVIAASWLVVRWDERRLERAAASGDRLAEERLARAWAAPGRDNALIGLPLLAAPLLGIVAVWFHFFRTRSSSLLRPWRWSPVGFLLGLAGAALVLLTNAVVVIALALALGMPLD
ncbi:MAG: hypothetical protein JWP97_145 [Labilithrix sp.]|nr:hypothetical protein [Labilithrix sp.]